MTTPWQFSLPYLRAMARTEAGRATIRRNRPVVQKQREEAAAMLAELDKVLANMALALGEGLPA